MTRSERILVVVSLAVIGGFVAIFATGALAWLNGRLEFTAGANAVQWTSGPATLAAVVVVVYHYFVRRCAVVWCPRYGEHLVHGTLKKVCHQHHTRADHVSVFRAHGAAHARSDKLNYGESHSLAKPRKPPAQKAK